MKVIFSCLLFIFFGTSINAQTSSKNTAADIYQQIKKLEVFGSVLYVAAHPDDENTRLLGYLANEKKVRTGYLSLTRGDGGQNLIGDEQGIDLGLIRTQELLSARSIDGAEQFFTRAYDFGFCKNPEEAMKIWEHDKVLADVVWVIRKFRPDVIITRFPTTGEGGHGHHTASAILAGEAFDAAANPAMFPEQLKYVQVWQAKRLLWNTFNFGNTNTTKEDQFKIDCGLYNPIIGKSYGEMAAESRSRHKSQGFGVPAQRGKAIEYFTTIKGDKPVYDLMDGIDVSPFNKPEASDYFAMVSNILQSYKIENPSASVKSLIDLYNKAATLAFVTPQRKMLIQQIIKNCAGIYAEVTAVNQLNTIGDSMKLRFNFINRSVTNVNNITISCMGSTVNFKEVVSNENNEIIKTVFVPADTKVTQPYFLVSPKKLGSYVADLTEVGSPEIFTTTASFSIKIDDNTFEFTQPVSYKYTDPVKGELYEPVQLVAPAFINVSPQLMIFSNNKKSEQKPLKFEVQSNIALNEKVQFLARFNNEQKLLFDSVLTLKKNEQRTFIYTINGNELPNNSTTTIGGEMVAASFYEHQYGSLHKISYDHIPDIFYNYQDKVKVLKMDLKTEGTKAGYIVGAGDKVPQALEQMGYTVTILTEKDINPNNLKQFDVVITGVRAYNIHTWLSNVYPVLMDYVKTGGVLLTQYNTNNSIGPVKANISPFPFTISRNRITDETAAVNFLIPDHPALNFPNKIVASDFDGWIQERSIYNAENVDPAYKKIISMKDPGEQNQDGSLIIADYGKGRFVYTGLVFFRELPAGVPGAYRLFANLIANKKK
ncbi:PIG-L family deacetylase [Ferruginibacter yonginensis]|uniref:PIG-L family deacetylase n=2 Tax=Ferruginibacter yonginensis TaxID=1310416 RepID=A0ABV8QRF1_9BACT